MSELEKNKREKVVEKVQGLFGLKDFFYLVSLPSFYNNTFDFSLLAFCESRVEDSNHIWQYIVLLGLL